MAGVERLLTRNRLFNCSICGGGLKQIRSGEYQCQKCGNYEYDDFGKVRKYLDENGPQPKEKIILDTGVTRAVVNMFLEEQRLEVAPHSEKALRCSICGKEIQSGIICSACKKSSSVKSGHVADKNNTENKMRFL